ncbi:MAG: flagellar basal body rod protein FlgB, partial [Burkholderiales bacterium]|nr:flagellar basal body rod protein FlgB [Burkholderiales bacterium]
FDFAAALRAATGNEALRAATGNEALRAATGNEALRAATGNEALRAGPQAPPVALLRTAASHLAPAAGASVAGVAVQYRVPAQGSLDGNSVELDAERAQFADNAIRYEAALRFLNHQIKSLLSAIQG